MTRRTLSALQVQGHRSNNNIDLSRRAVGDQAHCQHCRCKGSDNTATTLISPGERLVTSRTLSAVQIHGQVSNNINQLMRYQAAMGQGKLFVGGSTHKEASRCTCCCQIDAAQQQDHRIPSVLPRHVPFYSCSSPCTDCHKGCALTGYWDRKCQGPPLKTVQLQATRCSQANALSVLDCPYMKGR